MAPPLALLFDLDGTLVDSALDIAAALTELRAERGGGAVSPATVRPLVSHGAETLVGTVLAELAGDPAEDLARFRALLGGISPDPGMIYPGVVAALDELAAAGHALAVVTNKPEALSRTLLAALGLDRCFAAIVGGDTLPRRKPHPAPLRHALERIGAVPDGSAMIGDSPVDQAAAQACGVRFLLFDGGYDAAACAADRVAARFAAFAELPDLLRCKAAK